MPGERLTALTAEVDSQVGSLIDVDLASPGVAKGGVVFNVSESGSSCVRVKDDPKDDSDNKWTDAVCNPEGVALRRFSDGQEEGTHGAWSAIMNFINSIVGAGIIGLPYAMKQTGDYFGLVVIVVITFLTDYSVRLIIRLGTATGTNSYEDLTRTILGPLHGSLLLASMVVFALGAMLTYIIIIGDTLPIILENWTGIPLLGDRRFVIFTSAVLFCLPISSMRDIGKLGCWSFTSVLSIAILLILMLIRSTDYTITEPPPNSRISKGHTQHFSQAIAQVVFAFVCHHSCFLVRNTLARPSVWGFVTHVSVGVAFVLCSLMAVGGHRAFGDCTRPNILNNFRADDHTINVARLLLAFVMIFTYPMEFFVARNGMQKFLPKAYGLHWPLTLFIFFGTLFGGMFIPHDDLAFVLSFTGGTAASILGFIAPALLHFGYARSTNTPLLALSSIVPASLLALGVFLLLSNLFYASKDIALGMGYQKAPSWCPKTL
eukprot:TRINITY_DN19175_c0_g1_i1.p1 TRINITY_DN19175_c0_g1~~TRINITY_DN19175_c0_g1_i1.p1  ORF type:complete len:503 (+),score=105.83 TRINITY_DN19175_c0_g1_i1:45-1511(+)